MTENHDIPRRLHEHYHKVENDKVVKSIFNSGKNKEGKGMLIPEWMLTEEMKQTAHYQMYTIVFRVDVPTTQSQPIESTQGTHRIPSAHRTPNPVTTEGESSALCKPTIIRFRVQRQQDPETPIPTTAEIELDKKVQENLVDEEIMQLMEGFENVDTDEFMEETLNSQEDPDTRIEPRSDKESPKVKKSPDVLVIHDDEEEEESGGDALIRRKGKGIEEIRDSSPPTPIRSHRTLIVSISSDKETLPELTKTVEDAPSSSGKEKLKELTVTDPTPLSSTPSSSTPKPKRDRNEIENKIVPLYVAEGSLLDRKKTQDNMAKMIAEALQKER
ncbi:hypothetical protein Tco_0149227 [Tanacetum coccineum]